MQRTKVDIKKQRGKKQKKSTEQLEITMVGFFPPPYSLYLLTLSYFFIFITELQDKDCLFSASALMNGSAPLAILSDRPWS